MQMEDKVVLVTGGASGLGRGISLVLAERGADAAVADIHLEGAEKVAEELAGLGRKSKAFQVDVTKQTELGQLVADVVAHFGRIDVLVNAAGVIGAPGFEDTTTSREEDWDLTFDVNVKGTAMASDAVAAHMKERRSGKIVNIASHAGRGGSGGGGAYGASKAAVIHLTQSYALDLAPYDINVNVICPGTIWTPMWEQVGSRYANDVPAYEGMTPRQVFDTMVAEKIPMQKEQTPEDIADTVAFFVSDDAKNITGQALNVSGGSHMN